LAIDRGVKAEHIHSFLEEHSIPDFDIENFLVRLKYHKILTVENGYHDIDIIMVPRGAEALQKRRRTMAELD
jgi:hypothetical protein